MGFLEERGDGEEEKKAFACQAFLPVLSPHRFVLITLTSIIEAWNKD